MFVNTLTTDANYPLQDCEYLQVPNHMQLSEKLRNFSEFFVRFLESTLIFNRFEKKDDRHS